jgi:CubicO group peptidase (beta-lactamase class C family)
VNAGAGPCAISGRPSRITSRPDSKPCARRSEANFHQRGEVGCEVAICQNGELVVDLYGGHADAARTRAWRPETVVLVSSVTKGMATIAMALAPLARLDRPRGASGADGFVDPDARLGFGYTTNRCSLNAYGEPRV